MHVAIGDKLCEQQSRRIGLSVPLADCSLSETLLQLGIHDFPPSTHPNSSEPSAIQHSTSYQLGELSETFLNYYTLPSSAPVGKVNLDVRSEESGLCRILCERGCSCFGGPVFGL
jgi:hypothetical protein